MNRTLPLILTLDQHGVPHRWVTWQQAVWYYAKERVAWELGNEAFTVRGGTSHLTGERSSITANSIIAIRGDSGNAASTSSCHGSGTTPNCSRTNRGGLSAQARRVSGVAIMG